MSSGIKSYTSLRSGFQQRITDVRSGVLHALENPAPRVATTIERLRLIEAKIAGALDGNFTRRHILEIGPGQLFTQMLYFSRANRVTGIDLDVLVNGLDLRGYRQMWRCNGPLRVAKTLARKSLLYDARYRREFARQLGLKRLPRPRCLQMDATSMQFDDESFDAVMSFSVFEHLPDPGCVLDEVCRVLRPGGVAYTSIHLFTSDNGCHDPRLYGTQRGGLPLWAHLRPEHAYKVRPNAYLNKLRLADWVELFGAHMPGTEFERHCYVQEEDKVAAANLRCRGELNEYDDEELFTVDLAALWKKPGAKGRRR